jgi:pseudouridine kinase
MKHQVVCIGAMLVDELFYCNEPIVAATSNPASVKRTAGGVMRNIVHHLALLGIPAKFITIIGDDADGKWLKEDCIRAGIDMSCAITADCNTGKYSAMLNPDGSLYAAACVNPPESFLTISLLQQYISTLSNATMIVADTNLDIKVIEWLIAFCNEKNIRLFIEPVSVAKAKKLSTISLLGLFMITPNEDELASLSVTNDTKEISTEKIFARGVKHIWLRKGINGSEIISRDAIYSLTAPNVVVKDITGAGDAALAAWIASSYFGMDEEQCLRASHAMAAAVLQVEGAIATGITKEKLFESIKTFYPDES